MRMILANVIASHVKQHQFSDGFFCITLLFLVFNLQAKSSDGNAYSVRCFDIFFFRRLFACLSPFFIGSLCGENTLVQVQRMTKPLLYIKWSSKGAKHSPRSIILLRTSYVTSLLHTRGHRCLATMHEIWACCLNLFDGRKYSKSKASIPFCPESTSVRVDQPVCVWHIVFARDHCTAITRVWTRSIMTSCNKYRTWVAAWHSETSHCQMHHV